MYTYRLHLFARLPYQALYFVNTFHRHVFHSMEWIVRVDTSWMLRASRVLPHGIRICFRHAQGAIQGSRFNAALFATVPGQA